MQKTYFFTKYNNLFFVTSVQPTIYRIMKQIITTLITCCLFTFIGFAQNNCSKYYPMEEGTSFQYTNYDKKGKLSGTIDYTTTNYRKEDGLEIVTMKVNTKDKKVDDLEITLSALIS